MVTSQKIILKVERASASDEMTRRFSAKVMLPSSEKVDIVGGAVFADKKERSTRSGIFTAEGGVDGRVCVCDTYGRFDVDQALSYAKEKGALALIVTEEPKKYHSVGVPTIIISRDNLHHIKEDLPGAVVSVSYTSGSYSSIPVSLALIGTDEETVEWKGNMRVPTNTTDHLDLDAAYVSKAILSKKYTGEIAEFLNKDEMAGNVCLVSDCEKDHQFTQIVRLAAQYGATALFTTYEEPPSANTVLPVVVIKDEIRRKMKDRNMIISFSYGPDTATRSPEPKSKATPSAPKSYASAVQGRTSVSTSSPKGPSRAPKVKKSDKKTKKAASFNPFGILGDAIESVGRSIGLMYDPQSKKKFKAIVAAGTSWSKDMQLYHEAIELLNWVASVENLNNRSAEFEALIEAIREVYEDHDLGDVMLVAFCANLHNVLPDAASRDQLIEHTVDLVGNIKRDGSESIYDCVDSDDLDAFIVKLIKFLANKSLNKGSMKGFILNALWIRVFHCRSLKFGRWDDLKAIVPASFFRVERDVLLSFMSLQHYNTLSILTATSLRDVCLSFSGEDKVSVLRLAINGLGRLYQGDSTSRFDWQKEFEAIREVTTLNLLDRFEVQNSGVEVMESEKKLISVLVERIGRSPSQAFNDFESIYETLRIDSKLYDFVTEVMRKSICSQLEDRRNILSPSSVSELLQMSIGRDLLSNAMGAYALKAYAEHGLFKRYKGQDKDKLFVLGRMSRFLSNNDSCTQVDATSVILDAISSCIKSSGDCFQLCLSTLDISQEWQDIFYDSDDSELPLRIGEIIVTETGICSTVRASPLLLHNVISRLKSRHDCRLSHFLYLKLVHGLQQECKDIANAISFFESFCQIDRGQSVESKTIVSEIIFYSFSEWNPSSITDLLKIEATLLQNISDALNTISTGEGYEEMIKRNAIECLKMMSSVADKWCEKFKKDKFSMMELQAVRVELTAESQDSLTNVSGNQFPSGSDVDQKIAEMKCLADTIRGRLTFAVQKDDVIFSVSINDLSTHYRLQMESSLSNLTSKYFSSVDPVDNLSSIRRHYSIINNFVTENKMELEAASHFRVVRSALFQHEVGVWSEIHSADFFAKVSSSIGHLKSLLSPEATFSSVSAAVDVLDADNVSFDDEMSSIMAFLHVAEHETARVRLKHVMTLAKMTKRISNFVECCKTFHFAFTESDDCFGELESISDRLNGIEGEEWDVGKSLHAGERIVELLQPPPSLTDLSDQLQYYLPVIDFFDALRFCSPVFHLAREKGWFGKKGLGSFYEEFANVTNVIKHKQSFEMAVLDRLEPTIRCLSAVGDSLQCDRISSFLQTLDGVSDLKAPQNIIAMRLVQENVCKIQDWLSEGMDDMAAILGKFALIQSSGRIIVDDDGSLDEQRGLKRAISLHFSRNDRSDVVMDEWEIQPLIQYLGFATHNNDESRVNVERFIRIYEQCVNVMKAQQEMAGVGFQCSDATKRLEFVLDQNTEDLSHKWLSEADDLMHQCKIWLEGVRSSYRCSLLFWMSELRHIFQCMCDIHSQDGEECAIEQQMLLNILSQLPINTDCSTLIEQHACSLSGRSWLEDASIFVTECGNLSEAPAIPSCGSKRIIIHKVDCLSISLFASQLHLLQHIYKNQYPASFQYLDASCIRSSDHVAMFLERVKAFPEYIFVIAFVERLPASEQELIATFIANHAKSTDKMRLHCIQSKDTVLYASPGVTISAWDDSSLIEICPNTWLQNCLAVKDHIALTTTVYSDTSGSGKTKYIRHRLEAARMAGAQTASIYIHEDFTLTKAVEQLRDKFGESGSQKSIHFGLSWPSDSNLSDEFLMLVNHFFNSFILFGNVYDPTSGISFYGSSHKWDVFIEMNVPAEDEAAAQAWLIEHVPILSYCSSCVQQPPSDYDIDAKARRVAIYLRAYDDLSIDRKFNSTPAKKTILFVLDKSGSMTETDVGGRPRFQVASESMVNIYNSHVRVMDSVGLIMFDHEVEEAVPLQRIESEQDLARLGRNMTNLRIEKWGGTNMYSALHRVLDSLDNRTVGESEDVWIICLTDGASADKPTLIREQLRNTPDNLHMILIGVNLENQLHQAMFDLCNKYRAGNNPQNKGIFLPTALNIDAIEASFNQVASLIPVSQTFELDGVMSDEQCRAWLDQYRPRFISPENKLLYSFWISFIYRRVSVFDENDDFNYNETHESLGSSLMKVMLDESEQMLLRDQTDRSWSLSKHTQLIYDFSQPEEGPKFRLICTSPDDLDPLQKERFEQLDLPGFTIPNAMDLRRRETLDRYLSQALSIPLTQGENGNEVLQCIEDQKFVLTLDFTLKLLNIHEHVSCGTPCVMEGETGVSKTALTKMYSILVNSQQMRIASESTKETLALILRQLVTSFPAFAGVLGEAQVGVLEKINTFLEISPQLSATDVGRAATIVSDYINLASSERNSLFASMPSSFEIGDGDSNRAARAKEKLRWFSESHLEPTFFDINIDASLNADDIKGMLSEAKRVARKVAGLDMKIVVFLDEINTASVLGLIKEIIIDRSLNGEPLEENIVIIAACNPVRESSLSKEGAHRLNDLGREWVSGHYQVRQLPSSLAMISWDYGALKREQEKEFIQQRILMMDVDLPTSLSSRLTEILSSSHEFIRELARDHIKDRFSVENMQESEAVLRARSVVSLRDIQRVFHLTDFFLNHFTLESLSHHKTTHRFRRAMLVSVAIVYYLRLDAAARSIFVQKLNSLPTERDEECNLTDALNAAIDTVVEATEIPEGISLTVGLKENIFVTLVCALSRTPLMIIGPPGCSKTLAVSIVNDNANGEESPSQYYRNFARIQQFHYQCSKDSTSKEVGALFSRAEQRQMNVDRKKQQTLVFMDEAGLPPEDRDDNLKVLHYLLEGHMSSSPNVAFVCITNHILDAAKSNRCACLLRPEPDMDELSCISIGVLEQQLPGDTQKPKLVRFNGQTVEMRVFSDQICSSYMELTKDTGRFSFFVDFFGLRDFIHFLKFMRRNAPAVKDSILHISVQVIINALERNFNGSDKEKFANICAFFLAKAATTDQIKLALEEYIRDPMEVIHDALSEEHERNISRYNLPRYKMMIDHTNDDSLIRLLQIAGVLNSSHEFYKLSGIKEGEDIEKLTLVSRVKFAAQHGDKTVVLSQAQSVSECFYDLFNQHFKEFRNKDGDISYFANIAIGGISRPCPISPSFQCIVHVQANQLDTIPAPFLNRFEKFQINIDDILRWKLKQLSTGLRDILSESLQRVEELVSKIGDSSVWSMSAGDTLKSIYISLARFDASSGSSISLEDNCGKSIALDILQFIVSNFDVDITVKDIQSCIDSARTEYRSTKDGVELEKVIDCVSKGQRSLPFEDVQNGCLRTPMSRTLKQIVLSSITRCAVIRLLELVRPDALYLRRHAVPRDTSDVLEIYFRDQEHFSLKRLIKNTEKSDISHQFYMIYARSDSCAHSLPTWSHTFDEETVDPSILNRVRSLIHDRPSSVEIHHLDLLKSEPEIKASFDAWVSKSGANFFILVVDMKLQSANIVNFIRSYVEQNILPPDKKFFLLLHFPLSCYNSTYPALFLGKWRCIFLDGIGHADGNNVDLNNVLQSACSFEEQQLDRDSLLHALKPKAIQYVASQVTFYACSTQPQSINQVMPFTDRMIRVGETLTKTVGGKTLEALLCEKYIAMWTNDRVREVVSSAAYALTSGKSKLSFSSALSSTLQSSFNKFLAKSLLEINVWANLDVLDHLDVESEKIFALIISNLSLPGVPFQELLLLRDTSHPLRPLPTEIQSTELKVTFPFFYQISTLIEMAIDKSNFDLLDHTSTHQDVLERVDAMLSEMADGVGSMTCVVRDVVAHVAESECLFTKYMQHLLWSYGCEHSTHVEKWISHKMDAASALDERCYCNIVYLHIICRENVGGMMRISSWDSEDMAKELFRSKGQFEGVTFVSTVAKYFQRLLVDDNFDMNKWSASFSGFLQSIPTLMEGSKIEDEDVITNLRQLISLNILITVDAEERSVLEIVRMIAEDDTSRKTVMVSDCLDLMEAMRDRIESYEDVRDQVLRTFFSSWWLNIISVKISYRDALFLVNAVKEHCIYIKHQMAVIYLRNVLVCLPNGKQSIFPTNSFIPDLAVRLSLELNTTHVESFSESGERVGMPHFIPQWLSTGRDTPPMAEDIDDEISWYFRNYRNSFVNCPLTGVIYDIILGGLLENTKGISSDELLIMLQTSIQEQREVSQATHARLMRPCLDQERIRGPVSIKGCYLRALETDALLMTFICKVAEELAINSRSSAIEGVNALCAARILNCVMPLDHWPDLFFKIIMRLSGNGHLANLLTAVGGPLSNFDWCQNWIQGLSSRRQDVQIRLQRAETALREIELEEENKAREFRRCPHCREMFGVYQQNCGIFNCGRDAHGVGRGLGCGRDFRLEAALPYTRDETLLEPLRQELREAETSFEACNQGTELWARAERLEIPPMSFLLQKDEEVSILSKIFSKCLIENIEMTAEGENIKRLVSILDQLPRLKHVACLPDLIEFYMFIHRTFRHVVTREEAFNMKLQDIMDERLLKARFGVAQASHLISLWSGVGEKFNSFLSENDGRVTFECEDVQVPFSDIRDIPLIQVLSESEHASGGHDFLFLVISDLLMRYNNFIIAVKTIKLSRSNDDNSEEIHPRSLVRGSKNSIEVKGITEEVSSTLRSLIGSYWDRDLGSFVLEDLLVAIQREFDIICSLHTVMAPLTFLRERFVFRDCNVRTRNILDESDQCFCSSEKQFFFAQREDWMLYEDVRNIALRKCFVDVKNDSCSIRHKMIVTFRGLSHGEWSSLLEGLRNTLDELDFDNSQDFGEALKLLGSDSLQAMGFPVMDGAGAALIRSLSKDDIVEFIDVCGEQLSSEAYQFNRLPSRLAEPMTADAKLSLENSIQLLLEAHSFNDVHKEINAFCEETLSFYEHHIVTVSEHSNEPLHSYLRSNNACDESDRIFTALPTSLSLRNYVAVQKFFHQLKLRICRDKHCEIKENSDDGNHLDITNTNIWKMVAKPNHSWKAEEEFQDSIYDKLWFEEAIRTRDTETPTTMDKEADETTSDDEDTATLDEGSEVDADEVIVGIEEKTDDEVDEEKTDVEVDEDDDEDEVGSSLYLPEPEPQSNQSIQAGKISVEVEKQKEQSMTVVIIVAFVMALVAFYFHDLQTTGGRSVEHKELDEI